MKNPFVLFSFLNIYFMVFYILSAFALGHFFKCACDWIGFWDWQQEPGFTSSETAEKWWGLIREREYCICLVRKKKSCTEKNHHDGTWKRMGWMLFWMCWLCQVRIWPKNFSVVCNLREAWKVKPTTFYCPQILPTQWRNMMISYWEAEIGSVFAMSLLFPLQRSAESHMSGHRMENFLSGGRHWLNCWRLILQAVLRCRGSCSLTQTYWWELELCTLQMLGWGWTTRLRVYAVKILTSVNGNCVRTRV